MKIVTVNVPQSYLDAIERLLDNKTHDNGGIFPSRSELIRVAVREFLIRELHRVEDEVEEEVKSKDVNISFADDDKNFVHIPSDSVNKDGEPIREFKTYKIVKRLEY